MSSSKRIENLMESIRRPLNLISKPPANIVGQQNQIRYRFILGFTLVTCPILAFAQIVSSAGLFGLPFFTMLAFLIFIGLVASRSGYLNLAITIDLLSLSTFPYISLIVKEAWSLEYSFLILIWIPMTMLIGGYLLNKRAAALFIGAHDMVFLLVVLVHPGAIIFMSAFLESIIPVFAISLLVFVGSLVRQRHMNQLEKLNHELDAKNRELNIYTSLLTHDIGNDLHTCLLSTEAISQSLVFDPTSARKHVMAALAVGQRMGALLEVFSEAKVVKQSDVVSMIERIAEQAQITHGNLEINIAADEQCRSYCIVSRLIPMIFVNLFRNSATHAGKTPTVEVTISMNGNEALIDVNDDGPGVDPSIRDNLFEKGVIGTRSEGTGMGLYLIKQILETHSGTISLLDEDKCEGCGFHITLPCSSFTKAI